MSDRIETGTVGKLVVFEGPDAAGKSTIAQDVVKQLSRDRDVSLDSYPGKRLGTLGELVYRIHHNSEDFGVCDITPLALQSLHISAHLDAIESSLRPKLLAGQLVVLDRFWWSTWVYGLEAKADEAALDALIHAEITSWGEVSPAVILLIERETPLREDIPPQKWQALKDLYDRKANQEMLRGQRVVRIQNDTDKLAVVDRVVNLLNDIL